MWFSLSNRYWVYGLNLLRDYGIITRICRPKTRYRSLLLVLIFPEWRIRGGDGPGTVPLLGWPYLKKKKKYIFIVRKQMLTRYFGFIRLILFFGPIYWEILATPLNSHRRCQRIRSSVTRLKSNIVSNISHPYRCKTRKKKTTLNHDGSPG